MAARGLPVQQGEHVGLEFCKAGSSKKKTAPCPYSMQRAHQSPYTVWGCSETAAAAQTALMNKKIEA